MTAFTVNSFMANKQFATRELHNGESLDIFLDEL